MPYAFTNGIRLAYERHGRGERVLLIMGTGAGGRVWTLHQTPALTRAGYQAITFDNRGIPPSDVPLGRYSLVDMVEDTKGLVESLDAAPCRIVGVSLGAMIAQELAARWPELVRCAVLIGTRARADVVRRAQIAAARALADTEVVLPAEYTAATAVLQMLSPATLNRDDEAALWLETFELFSSSEKGSRGQLWADDLDDHRESLARVTAPCRVVAFADDLMAPPHLGREVADAIPDCDFRVLDACGHYGYLERPDEVNAAIVDFLAEH